MDTLYIIAYKFDNFELDLSIFLFQNKTSCTSKTVTSLKPFSTSFKAANNPDMPPTKLFFSFILHKKFHLQ